MAESKAEALDMVEENVDPDHEGCKQGLARRGWAVTEWKHKFEEAFPGGEDYHPDGYFKSLVAEGTIAWYRAGGWEQTKKGLVHRHSKFWFPANQKKTKIYKILGYRTWAKALYHQECYDAYMDKESAGPTFGEMVKGGARTDIKEAYEDCKKANGDLRAVMEARPVEFMKYHGAMTKVVKEFEEAPDYRKIETYVLNGKPNTRKTHRAACLHGKENVYILTKDIYESKFWRGYKRQQVLVIDEFTSPWIKLEVLNGILEGHPYVVPVLHSYVYARWTKVYITCNRGRRDTNFYHGVWGKFPHLRQAFDRRITKWTEVNTPFECPHIAPDQGQLRSSYVVTRLTII